jgi:hypothetical protein
VWRREARSILTDSLETLQTFDTLAAFRNSGATRSGGIELAWDPPTSDAWAEATHVTRGATGRAAQLLQAISNAQLDPSQWRHRRELAEAANALVDLGGALGAYRLRIDRPGGEGTPPSELLQQAWDFWEAAATRWGVNRAEAIPCSS